jgi:5-(carboxyamino)imidazole ribonucleotide synthase
MSAPLPPGSTIGIVGCGQLGRMLASAAARLGFETHTFGPEENPPAARVATRHMAADYADEDALGRFAQDVDVATYEFENIPQKAVRRLMRDVPCRPGEAVLAVCQDRAQEKAFLKSLGIKTAPYALISGAPDLVGAVEAVGGNGIMKARRFGYDGKGQARLRPGADPGLIHRAIGEVPAILEGFLTFDFEISQIAARDVFGEKAFYEAPRNDHDAGILRRSTVPSGLPVAAQEEARRLTGLVMDELDYVGVMCLEFFWSAEDGLIANEIAPRVHNSGHWTHEACVTSQFEQHIRAVAGWPLGSTDRQLDAEMQNLLGEEANDWLALSQEPGARLTLYGKKEARGGRKMGHVTRTWPPGERPG